MAGGIRWRNRQNLERIVDLDAAMPRMLGMMTARRPGSFPFAKAMCSEGARCLLRGTAAVPSMLRNYQQFPTTAATSRSRAAVDRGRVLQSRRALPAWTRSRSRCRSRSQSQQHISLTYSQDLTSWALQAQFIFEPKKFSDGWRVASDGETGRIWGASSILTLRCRACSA